MLGNFFVVDLYVSFRLLGFNLEGDLVFYVYKGNVFIGIFVLVFMYLL